MTDSELKKALCRVGITSFVKYYKDFADIDKSDEQLTDLLLKNENFKQSSCKTKIYSARKIISSGRSKSALQVAADANPKKVHKDIINLARIIEQPL